jgi:hypothetical protein
MSRLASLPGDLLFYPVVQKLRREPIRDLPSAVRAALEKGAPIRSGERIAVAVGSRGIHRLEEVVRAIVRRLQAAEAEPFVLAAMGSHGGSNAGGQKEVLAGYGVTGETMGAVVEASMETVNVGAARPAPFSRLALEADGIVLVNRVKPHTSLTGTQGSGLRKMLAVGLGNAVGARALHGAGLQDELPAVTRSLLGEVPVRAGMALVEDATGGLSRVEGTGPESLVDTDIRLLAQVRATLPKVPLDPLDALVLLWMGKNISGTGMDPNVIGMHRRSGGPVIRRIGTVAALRLTAMSHGNGNGIGMADLVPRALAESLDLAVMKANAAATGWKDAARIPPTLPTEREVIARACAGDPGTVRAVLARDTSHLACLLVTEALLPDVESHPHLAPAGEPVRLEFDGGGKLVTKIETG